MELREAHPLRRYYRGERARVLREYRRHRRQGDMDLAAHAGEKASFLLDQLSRVERWIRILQSNPGSEGNFSVATEQAQMGRVIWVGETCHRIVGIGWADQFDSQGAPSTYKVATVRLPLNRKLNVVTPRQGKEVAA